MPLTAAAIDIRTADDLLSEINETLTTADPKFVAYIAQMVLGKNIRYTGSGEVDEFEIQD